MKRKRTQNSLNVESGRRVFETSAIVIPSLPDVTCPKLSRSLADREPISMRCKPKTAYVQKGSFMRKYKWWVRANRTVLIQNSRQEYANGHKGDYILIGQLSNKGIGGKLSHQEKVRHLQGSNSETHLCSSKLTAEPEGSYLLKRTGYLSYS